MITPTTLIKLNEQSDAVANLHAAMTALGLVVDAKEVAERRAGDSTLKVMRAFQKQIKIKFDEKLLVDAATAVALVKLLIERGLFKPPPDVDNNPDFVVKGTITSANGNPLRDLAVVAFDQDLRTRQELGATRANAKGEYSITYGQSKLAKAEKGSADLVVEVRSPQGETLHVTNILFNAPVVAEIGITLNASQGPSQFEQIKSEVERLIEGNSVSLLALEENEQFKDATFISGETGIEKEKIEHFIVTQKLAERSKLDPEFWYAALRGAVFSNAIVMTATDSIEKTAAKIAAAVPETNVANVEVALKSALGANLINARFEKNVAAWLKQFRSFAAERALNDGDAKSPSKVKQVLTLSGLAEAKQTKFAEYYVESGSDRNEAFKRLRQDKSFTATEVANIEKTLVLNDLTLGNMPLVQTLSGRVKDANTIRNLAKTRREDWEKLLLQPTPGRPAVVPEFIAGNSPEEKARNYATLLTNRFKTEYPTAAFTGGLERAIGNKEKLTLKHAGTMVEFFNAHPEFELHTMAVEPFVEKNAGRIVNPEQREVFTQELKAAQRVFKLAPSFEATNTLLADGIHSAHQISRMGETKFARKYGDQLGFTEASARSAFQKAANTQAAVTTLLGELAAAQNASAVHALSKTSTVFATDNGALAKNSATLTVNSTALSSFPNLQNLFGQADICECEHCRSVYSPAAYFTDVLMFLDARDSLTPAVSVKQVLFERRPELGNLELSCDNSNTPLPYVDLACEVLEDRVAPWHLFNLPISLEPSLVKGLVPGTVSTAFSNAIPSITLSADATISDKINNSYWVIRDSHETYRVLRATGSLEVSILRQTHNTADELRANPEYVNEAAYTVLRAQKYPWSLPFDLFTEELRAYLAKVNIKRADLMTVFRGVNPPNQLTLTDIGSEYFGIAKDEQVIILQPNAANQFVYWGEANNAAAIANASRVDVFLQKTGLEYNDLLKLLSLEFINPNGTSLKVVHLDSSCDTSKKRIDVLDATSLDRIHRFLRLWRKLGWQLWEVDLVLRTTQIGIDIDAGFIHRLKLFVELKEKLRGLTVEQLYAFYDDLNTTPKFTESYRMPEPSLYEQLFLNKKLTNPVNAKFAIGAVTVASPTETLNANLPPILSALRINEADVTIFSGLKQPGNGATDKLSLKNLSFLSRHAQLAKLLKLKATEWRTLLYLAQVNPFQNPQTTLDFVETVERIRASKFSVDELAYVLSADFSVKPAPARKNITLFLARLQGELKKIAAEYEASTLPDDAEGLTLILTTLLQKLNRAPEVVTAITELMNDQNVTTVHLNKPFPPNFEFPASITKDVKISYDPAHNNLSFTGVMTNAIKITLLTDPSMDSLLSDPKLDPNVVSTKPDYQHAVDGLYNAPRHFAETEMKFFTSPVFSVPLAALPDEVNFTQLPKDLGAKILFDGEQKLLQFTGEMASAEQAALKSLSLSPADPVNIAYVAAIDVLNALSNSPASLDDPNLWIKTSDIDQLFDNPNIPVSGPDNHVADNLKSVTAKIYNYFRPLLSEAVVVQQFSESLGLSPAIARKLLKTYKLFGSPTPHPLLEDYTGDAFVASTKPLTAKVHAKRHVGYYWLDRVALVLKKIKITFSDLQWTINHHAQTGVLDWKSLPKVYDNTIPPIASLNSLLNLSDYMEMHRRYSDTAISMLDMVDKLISYATYNNVGFSKDVELLTGWNAADIEYLTTANVLDISYPAAYQDVLNWNRLAKAIEIIERLNGSAQSVMALAVASVGQAESLSIKQMLRSKYEVEQWLDISGGIQDELRHRKRDSLVAYLLTQPMPLDAPTQKWENANDLYAYYLIDVEMCSCQLTSRMVQASGAIQLFVQRCFMGLEPRVRVSAEEDDAWKQWKWMKNYRVWEANRKVFLYPENWIEPELRRDKSQFFKDLENELLQNEVNRDNVETAFLNYIEKLDQVAQLEIAGTFYQEDNHTLHVFARTPGGDPHTYYYRQWIDDRRWTAWSKVECDIKGDHLIPVVMEQRLYLVWPEFREEPVEVTTVTVPQSGATLQKPEKISRIHLAISEYRNNKWSPKKVSKDFIEAGRSRGQTFDKSGYFFLPLDFTHLPGGKFLIIFYDFPALRDDIGPAPVPQIFELLGCKGYPEKSVDPFNFRPIMAGFMRGKFKFMKNSESVLVPGANDALFPHSSRYLHSTILDRTPGQFKISYPHYLSHFDKLTLNPNSTALWLGTYYNWFYADKTRTFFVRPQVQAIANFNYFYNGFLRFANNALEQIQPQRLAESYVQIERSYQWSYQTRLLFQNFYHPHTCLFAKQLYNHGVDGLMSRQTQFADNKLNFSAIYGPTNVVNTNHPQEVVDFTPGGSYSQYNWELFFHAPLMIAMRLSKNQRFDEAMKWFHYIFDPTGAHDRDPITGAPAPAPQKFWNTNPFFKTTSQAYASQRIDEILKMLADDPLNPTDPAVKQELVNQVADWRANPFDPHMVAQFRMVAYQKTTVMKYIDNLIAWGDQLFRQDTMESVNEAAQLYVQAAEILGPRPRKVPPPQKPVFQTFNELRGNLDAFSNAIVNFENLVPVLPGTLPTNGQPPLPGLLYFCIPQNDQMLAYWDRVADRLYKIRHCLNIEGVFRQLSLFAPPIDPGALVKAVAAGVDISSALNDLSAPLPHYRFNVILQKANEFVGDVKALGGALLSALQNKDAEALSLLRQSHELKVLEAVKAIKGQQIDDAKLALDGLKKNKELITIRRDFYSSREFMNPGETAAMTLSGAALISQTAGTIADVLAGVMFLIPDFHLGGAGFGGTPHVVAKTGGTSFGKSGERGANGLYQIASLLDRTASIAATVAGYQRRKEDWQLQKNLANKELEQIEKQIASAELKISITEKELQNHELQIENSKVIDEFMHSKYTNLELYNWMLGQISQIYFQSYQLAYDMAKRAEKCFQYELGVENTSYIQFGYWDSLKKGLLSGEKLQYDLRGLDAAYIELNRREFELTKHISLTLTNPAALLQLKENGWCFFDLPEELFDLDYQGHYFRRIKSVGMSIPCVAGPYTTVNATLRLIKNSVRINTQLGDEGQYEHNSADGVLADDSRFRDSHVNVKAIATGSAQNDSGMFDLNFRDERYLPFEGAGAISTWKLEMTDTKELRQFDYNSISDVIVHMKYTAREDVGQFKQGAVTHLTTIIQEASSQLPLRRLFNLKHEFPTEWYALFHPTGAGNLLALQFKKDHFPFFAQEKNIQIGQVTLLMKSEANDLTVQLDPGLGVADQLALSQSPSFGDLHFGTRDFESVTFNESVPWSIQVFKSSGVFVENDIEECFLIIEYTLA